MVTTWETPLERVRRDYDILRRYLARLGADAPASPPSEKGVLILAPPLLRRENTPSFLVRAQRIGYGWRDWGTDEHGTVIDLVMKGERLSAPGEALAWLLDWIGEMPAAEPIRPVSAPSAGDDNPLRLRYANAAGVANKAMQDYLSRRGISSKGWRFLHDIGWTNTEKPGSKFFGVGIRNLRGDWHARSALDGPFGKVLVRGRDEDRNGGGGPACSLLTLGSERTTDVVEGILNGLALHEVGFAGGKLLCMNGSAQSPAAASMLKSLADRHPDVRIRLHGDHDAAGEKARQIILEAVDGANLADLSGLYAAGDALDRLKADRDALAHDLAEWR